MIDLYSIYKTPVEIAEIIAKNARSRRKSMKLSQKELAEKSGVSYASVRRFESTGEISFVSLLAIAEVLEEKEEFEKLFTARHYRTMEEFLNG
ncbi:MAG: helix-turn-helix transcriptional regulator [Spirochaetales bacterium]|nr:helix-turn-helix transcriptional regulator [Candidatus Physcosoma equi]